MNKGGYNGIRYYHKSSKRYYKDHEMNILHREDGPAVEYIDGYKIWYIDGKSYSEEEFKNAIKELNELKKTKDFLKNKC